MNRERKNLNLPSEFCTAIVDQLSCKMSMEESTGVGMRERKKKATLAGYEAARENAKKGISALDALEFEDQGDVYDMVDEEEYEQIVEARRGKNDFVVDDGAYYAIRHKNSNTKTFATN